MKTVFGSRSARVLTIVLIVQAAVFYGLAFGRSEAIPQHRPLDLFSIPGNTWLMRETLEIDPGSLSVLQADDILSRLYQNRETGDYATLFVAYFETQRTGKTPHSPKNCLPGAGWASVQSGLMPISVPGQATPIQVNRYVVARGQNQSVVLYWYQARHRVIAREFAAKLYTIEDSIRHNRSDEALVRVVVGVNGGDIAGATKTAVSFVKAFFDPLREYLPS